MENFCCSPSSSFTYALQSLGLSTSAHPKGKSSKESFLELFSQIIGKNYLILFIFNPLIADKPVEDVMEIIKSFSDDSLFRRCREIENGHFIDFGIRYFDPKNPKCFVHLGWIVAIAKSIGKNVVLVCSCLSYAFMRAESNPLVILKFSCEFNYSSINTIVVGVSEFNTYHQIDAPSEIFFSKLLMESSVDEDGLKTKSEELMLNSSRIIQVVEDESELVDDFSTNECEIFHDMLENDVNSTNDCSLTLDEAIRAMSILNVKDQLNFDEKINFISTGEEISLSRNFSVSQTFDCDGIFVFGDATQIEKVMKCPLTILRSPRVSWKRDKISFENSFSHVFKHRFNSEMVQIGKANINEGSFDFFVYYGFKDENLETGIAMRSFDHAEFVKNAVESALKFPCELFEDHMANCKSKELRNQRESSIPFSGYREDVIAIELIPCFFQHLEFFIYKRLGIEGVKIHFYLRLIGSKSVIVANCPEELLGKIDCLFTSINVFAIPSKQSAIDYCVQSVIIDEEESGNVSSFCFLKNF